MACELFEGDQLSSPEHALALCNWVALSTVPLALSSHKSNKSVLSTAFVALSF